MLFHVTLKNSHILFFCLIFHHFLRHFIVHLATHLPNKMPTAQNKLERIRQIQAENEERWKCTRMKVFHLGIKNLKRISNTLVDEFYNVDSDNILLEMINLKQEQFVHLYDITEDHFKTFIPEIQGVCMKTIDMDIIFMILSTKRTGSKWSQVATIFCSKTA